MMFFSTSKKENTKQFQEKMFFTNFVYSLGYNGHPNVFTDIQEGMAEDTVPYYRCSFPLLYYFYFMFAN